MIRIDDPGAALRETKSQRKELKLKPSVARAIEEAAHAVGMDSSTFIAAAAYRAAREVARESEVTTLPPEAFDAFAAAVDRPGEARPALRALLAEHRAAQGG